MSDASGGRSVPRVVSRVHDAVGDKDGRTVVVVDSVTTLDATAQARTVVCGSHGGLFSAALAVSLGVRAIVLNDAGVGKDRAGIAGLDLLDKHGIPAATVGHLTADIANGESSLRRGVLSHVNSVARQLGCAPGMPTIEATRLLSRSPSTSSTPRRPPPSESRHLLRNRKPRVWALDSASLVRPDDVGDILLTGSHGELIGGRPETALKADALAAVFNDAGRARQNRLPGRLATLDERGIAAATVDVHSARIGDGRSTYFEGVLSAVNETAAALGAERGTTARGFTDQMLANRPLPHENGGDA